MGSSAFSALSFIIGTLFDLYALVVGLRFVMQACRVDYYNPIAQLVVQLTDPVVVPLQKIIPRIAGYDIAALILCTVIYLLKMAVFVLLDSGSVSVSAIQVSAANLSLATLLPLAVLQTVNLLFNIFIFSLFIYALLSWVVQDPRNPVYELTARISSPIVQFVRRFIPAVGGFDLSVLFGAIGLTALKIFVVGSLTSLLF